MYSIEAIWLKGNVGQVLPNPHRALTVPTCGVGLSGVGGEADRQQVGELGGQVVFPGDH